MLLFFYLKSSAFFKAFRDLPPQLRWVVSQSKSGEGGLLQYNNYKYYLLIIIN